MRVSSSQLLKKAQNNHYAVPAVNFIDGLTANAYLAVAEKLNMPMILAFAQAHNEWLSLEEAAWIGTHIQEKATVPIVLHLDHGQDIHFIQRAIDLGFNSVMIDASTETFANNVKRTKEVVNYAHDHGVDVEAEIGFVGANENLENHELVESIYTEVEDAIEFVNQTKVDSLAISIGTAHGIYKGTPKINFKRLSQIRERIDIPLVLHGGSSTGYENLNRCAREGITKINLFSDMINAGFNAINMPSVKDYPSLIIQMKKSIEKQLEEYYAVFGLIER
ncbi:class II fructose-bisphosphate aldolase [Facklamia miroungae]|uniref:Fructose-bisphosphate aldolase, class II n=1 Tax=Facklamia miroungae TaxID=120956 RepID=A0A1G7UD73_9LACT|nr:class II fructose-bisphosphate aldolase [Facklamia miroungae]NKZ30049.1 class II fructose-bisphosphate aldolase [Facklamia miroungae]SDG44989.1 fructose-bisphosphate aldolase, class II [Facklamia miroungae]